MLTRFIEFFGLKKSIVGLLSMVILVGMGERIAERFLPIYLLALGGGVFAIGTLSAMQNLLGALYSYPGGYLSDRVGVKKALLIFNMMSISGYLIVAIFPSWYAVLVGAILFMSWSAVSLPATMSLVAMVLPKDKRTMGVSMHSLVRRFPMALGPVIGGIFIATWGEVDGVRVAFVAAILMSFISIILQQGLIDDDSKDKSLKNSARKNPITLFKEMSGELKNLLFSDILIRFCEQIPYAFVVVWCMKIISKPVSAVDFGVLTTVEMATAVLIYLPVAYLADKGTKKPFVVITFVFFTIFPLVLYFSRSFWILILAFIIRGLKEFGEPTRKALIMDLAPEDKKAQMFGLYYLIRDLIVSVGAFSGALLWWISPEVNFAGAFLCGACGTVWFVLKGK